METFARLQARWRGFFVKLKSFPEMEKIWEIFQSGGGKAKKLTVAAIRRADAARDPQQTNSEITTKQKRQ